MPTYRTVRRVRHGAADMFALVADVERYPQFLPWCVACRVRQRVAGAGGIETITADMTVGYRAIRETFTSRALLDAANLKIAVEYLDGPFRHLENTWHFVPVEDRAADVEFFITYEFRSRTLALVMGAMFDVAFRRFAEAFERRADALFGDGSAGATQL